MNRPDFFQHANCTGHPLSLFFPEISTKQQTQQAKQICNTCPVQQDCLEYALNIQKHSALDGIFGGTTPYERRKMIKHPTPIVTPPKPRYTHGTLYGYRQAGCRCPTCKAAHTRTISRQRRARRETT